MPVARPTTLSVTDRRLFVCHSMLSVCLLYCGEHAAALSHIDLALLLQPTDGMTLYRRGKIQCVLGECSAGLCDMQKAERMLEREAQTEEEGERERGEDGAVKQRKLVSERRRDARTERGCGGEEAAHQKAYETETETETEMEMEMEMEGEAEDRRSVLSTCAQQDGGGRKDEARKREDVAHSNIQTQTEKHKSELDRRLALVRRAVARLTEEGIRRPRRRGLLSALGALWPGRPHTRRAEGIRQRMGQN